MDNKYSQLKRRSCFDPENTLSLQLLRRRLGLLPIANLYTSIKFTIESMTKTCANIRTLTRAGMWSRDRTETRAFTTWTRSYTKTKTQRKEGCRSNTESQASSPKGWGLTRGRTNTYCGR